MVFYPETSIDSIFLSWLSPPYFKVWISAPRHPPFKSPLLVGFVYAFLSVHFYLNAINESLYRNKLLVAFQFWFEAENLGTFRTDQEVEGMTNFGANLKIACPASVSNGVNFLHELARKRLLRRVTRRKGLLIKLSIRVWALQPVSKFALSALFAWPRESNAERAYVWQELHFRLPKTFAHRFSSI